MRFGHWQKNLRIFHVCLPHKFVTRRIITKLPSSWPDFVTYRKQKRQEFTVADLIGSSDVEKSRTKDTRGTGEESDPLDVLLFDRSLLPSFFSNNMHISIWLTKLLWTK